MTPKFSMKRIAKGGAPYCQRRKEERQIMSDTRQKIISAAMAAVRINGIEGVRIQNISELAGITPGAVYRHFKGKDEILEECFTYVDKQAAEIFDHIKLEPALLTMSPINAIHKLWQPYFHYWLEHPDETIFYFRFRDRAFFYEFDKTRNVDYFGSFIKMVNVFKNAFPRLAAMNQNILWLHVLTTTILYAKYIAEGILPNTQDTEDAVFELMTTGLEGYLRQPEKGE